MKSCKRPFENTEEMNYYILDYIIKNIDKRDRLYILGDLGWSWNWIETVLNKCPYQTYVIFGNHDKRFRNQIAKMVHWSGDLRNIKIDKQLISLSHYAGRVWNNSHWGAWQLYAHSHSNLPPIGKQHDVGIDNNNYKFLTFDEIVAIMKTYEPHHYIHPQRGEIYTGR